MFEVWDWDSHSVPGINQSKDLIGIAQLEFRRIRNQGTDAVMALLWVKFRGRRAGCLRVEITMGTPADGEIPVAIVVLGTHGLRDANNFNEPIVDLTNAASYGSLGYAIVGLLSYLVLGSMFYSQVECALFGPEEEGGACADATVTDALYFSVVTFTTVGYGDMGPTTAGTRLFTCFFVLYGISLAAGSLSVLYNEVSKWQKRRVESKTLSHALHLRGAMDDTAVEDAANDADDDSNLALTAWAFWKDIANSIFWMVVTVGAGWIFYAIEKPEASSIDCLYYSIITSTTVGYGDESPASTGAKSLRCSTFRLRRWCSVIT